MIYASWQASRLNKTAWEAVYKERNLPLPDGPRDGYWGARIGTHVEDPRLGWILPALSFPGLLEIDAKGMQHVSARGTPRLRLLIMGASVAFGGYASTIEKTYFAQLGQQLASAGMPVDITVYATGAWKSVQELKALQLYGLDTNPDAVIFLDGLNDLTNGSNAHTLYGVQTTTLDGSRWQPLYTERDYDARVRGYLTNMAAVYEELSPRGIPFIVALQPALFEKPRLSPLEERIERDSLRFYGAKADLLAAYDSIRAGLADLAQRPHAYFIDCSRPYGSESATVFTDIWHFSDPGHAMLASVMAKPLLSILTRYDAERAREVPAS
jgi:hypothetical protein